MSSYVYNVLDYGATGDGSTDDTNAISAAITAISSVGGVLVFPAGTYLTSGGFTLSYPTRVVGAGRGNSTLASGLSVIKCNHATNSLFTVNSVVGSFKGLDMLCTNATPTAGAGIVITNGASFQGQQIDFDSVNVRGFYDNVDIGVGNAWTMRGCAIGHAVRYGVRIRNTVNADAGDWAISDCVFHCGGTTFVAPMDALVRIESSGGGKIVNCKFNAPDELATNGLDCYFDGITTGILLIDNCSFENVANNGVNINYAANAGTYKGISVRGCQFGFWNGSNGNTPINIEAYEAGHIAGVTIIGNLVIKAPNSQCITMTNIDNVFIDANVNLEATDLLSATTCTNVLIGSSAAP